MQRKFEQWMRRTGNASPSLTWYAATPEQKSKLNAASNLAAEAVFGSEGHAKFLFVMDSDGRGFRFANFQTSEGIYRTTLSENPSEAEIKGAAAAMYQLAHKAQMAREKG